MEKRGKSLVKELLQKGTKGKKRKALEFYSEQFEQFEAELDLAKSKQATQENESAQPPIELPVPEEPTQGVEPDPQEIPPQVGPEQAKLAEQPTTFVRTDEITSPRSYEVRRQTDSQLLTPPGSQQYEKMPMEIELDPAANIE